MARFDFRGLDNLMKQMSIEEDRIRRRAPDALRAGAAVMIEELKQNAPVDTGGLRDSIDMRKRVISYSYADGYFIEVGPGEGTYPRTSAKRKKQEHKRKRGEPYKRRYENPPRYRTIAWILEFGTSTRPAKPWMRKTVAMARRKVNEAMRNEILKD